MILQLLVAVEMPLADERCAITGLLEHGWQQHLLKKFTDLRFAVNIVVDAKPLLILTRQQSHPRRHANRGGHIGVGKQRAFFREAVDVWSGDL